MFGEPRTSLPLGPKDLVRLPYSPLKWKYSTKNYSEHLTNNRLSLIELEQITVTIKNNVPNIHCHRW